MDDLDRQLKSAAKARLKPLFESVELGRQAAVKRGSSDLSVDDLVVGALGVEKVELRMEPLVIEEMW